MKIFLFWLEEGNRLLKVRLHISRLMCRKVWVVQVGGSLSKGVGSLGLSRERHQTPHCLFVEAGGGVLYQQKYSSPLKLRGIILLHLRDKFLIIQMTSSGRAQLPLTDRVKQNRIP